MSTQTNCPCDCFVHPRPLDTGAGLNALPRQIADFAEFRRALLAAVPAEPALSAWRAVGDQDLGVMLLEMWAYVCDVTAFYDETIGYRPRPAIGASAHLAIKADGRLPLILPEGLAFRSTAFDAEAPQVFELGVDTKVHPLLNGWQLKPVRPVTIAMGSTKLLLAPDSARAKAGDALLVLSNGVKVSGPHIVQSVARVIGRDRATYSQVTLASGLQADVTTISASLVRTTATTALWTGTVDPAPLAAGDTMLTLSGVVPQIRAGDCITASTGKGTHAFTIVGSAQATRILVSDTKVGNPQVTVGAVIVPVTRLTIDPGWPNDTAWLDPTQIAIGYGLQDVGSLTAELKPTIDPGDPLDLADPVEAPPDGTQPASFLAADTDGAAMELKGGVDFTAKTLELAVDSALARSLRPPASVYANVVGVTRGESVPYELLGIGDGSVANQSFKLKKKPLTYLFAPTADDPAGIANTLAVRVRGILWREVKSFYGVAADAEVYIVRQSDDNESTITFGDGVRGARLPSGADVSAAYRFGAGAASPPAGGITQLAKPVKGLTSVKNPVAAAGGADVEAASNIKVYAPRSALLFGRAVSIKDMEALASSQPGVVSVSADWTWKMLAQQPAVQIYYIGAASLAPTMSKALRAATAPATLIQASPATAVAANLSIDIRVDRRYQVAVVQAAAVQALTAADTGLLSPALIGIGRPLYRSALIAAVLGVEGVATVHDIRWNQTPFDPYGQAPGDGKWFDVHLSVSATEDQDG